MTTSYGIVGSRQYRPVRLVASILDRLEAAHADTGVTIVSGGEPTGVDNVVEQECRARGYYHFCMEDEDTLTHLPEKWHCAILLPEDGSARAKFARNSKVVQHVGTVVALFADGPRSPGTSDTVTKARRAGMPVYIHHEGHWERT